MEISTPNIILILEMIVGITAMFFLSAYEEKGDKHPSYKWYAIILYLICVGLSMAYSITLEVM